MSDELRQARERLRRIVDGIGIPDDADAAVTVYGVPDYDELLEADLWKVARNDLREHPADDEPTY